MNKQEIKETVKLKELLIKYGGIAIKGHSCGIPSSEYLYFSKEELRKDVDKMLSLFKTPSVIVRLEYIKRENSEDPKFKQPTRIWWLGEMREMIAKIDADFKKNNIKLDAIVEDDIPEEDLDKWKIREYASETVAKQQAGMKRTNGCKVKIEGCKVLWQKG